MTHPGTQPEPKGRGHIQPGAGQSPSMSPEWGHIGQRELIATLVILVAGKIFLSYPTLAAEKVDSAGWLGATIAAAVSGAGVLILINLMNRFPDYSFTRVSLALTGRYIGALINLVMVALFLAVATLILRESSETLVIGILPLTPLSVLTVGTVVVVAYGAYLGIEAVSRTSFLLAPWLITLLGAIFLGAAKSYDFNRLYPIWGSGPASVINFGLTRGASLYIEIIAVAFLYPAIREKKKILGSTMKALGLSWVLLATTPALVVAAFGVTGAARTSFPIYYIARLVEFGRFLTRLEAVFVFLWFFTAGLKVTIAFYVAIVALSDTLHLPNYKPLVPSMAVILYTLAFLSPSYLATANFEGNVYRRYASLIGFGIPLVLLVVAVVRRKRQSAADEAGEAKTDGG